MIKFIDKCLERYANDLRLSKWHSLKYGAVVAFLIFGTSYTYSSLFENKTPTDNAIISAGTAICLGLIWSFMSVFLVKQKDRRYAEEAAEREKIIEERRERASKKVNNKKKKKHRKEEAQKGQEEKKEKKKKYKH